MGRGSYLTSPHEEQHQRRPRHKRASFDVFRYLITSLAAILAVLLLLEGTIRVLGLNWRILTRRPDPWIGTMYPAGTVVRWGKEGYGVTHYIADGEIATPFNQGMEILVLGDSHTEAFQVDDQDKYVSVAETLLWQRGCRVNLRNLGLGGLSFADYVYWVPQLRKQNRTFRAFVIQLSDDDFEASYDSTAINFFRRTSNGGLELVHRPPDPSSDVWRNPWWSYIRLFDYLNERWYDLFTRTKKPRNEKAPARPVSEITASVTAQVQMLSERLGDVPVIFLRAPKWPYADPPEDPTLIAFHTLQKAQPWPVIDPGEEMVRFYARTHRDPRTFFNGIPMNAHLNRYGQAILGQMLAERIERMFFTAIPPKP
jgi:hypothetical protein